MKKSSRTPRQTWMSRFKKAGKSSSRTLGRSVRSSRRSSALRKQSKMDNRTEAPPRLFLHCSAVFEKMKAQSKARQVEGDHALVYEGFLTKLICEDLGLATPYYTSVMHYLKAMGCVRQLARGGGPTPSLWELMHEPDIEAFERVESQKKKP